MNGHYTLVDAIEKMNTDQAEIVKKLEECGDVFHKAYSVLTDYRGPLPIGLAFEFETLHVRLQALQALLRQSWGISKES